MQYLPSFFPLPSLLIYPLTFKMKKNAHKIDRILIKKMTQNILQIRIFGHMGEARPRDTVKLKQLEETGCERTGKRHVGRFQETVSVGRLGVCVWTVLGLTLLVLWALVTVGRIIFWAAVASSKHSSRSRIKLRDTPTLRFSCSLPSDISKCAFYSFLQVSQLLGKPQNLLTKCQRRLQKAIPLEALQD